MGMNVRFSDDKIRSLLSDKSKFTKQFGPKAYRGLQNLLLELQAADSMYEFWPEYSGTRRCHELKNKHHRDFRNHFSLTIIDKVRIIARPEQEWIDANPATRTWSDVRSITIVYVGDYHDD